MQQEDKVQQLEQSCSYTWNSQSTVTTQSATNIAQTSCTGNGNITQQEAIALVEDFVIKVGTSGDPSR